MAAPLRMPDDISQLTTPMPLTEEVLRMAREAREDQGIHETEVSFSGEAGLHESLDSCEKNPGHLRFTPITEMCAERLPELLSDPEMAEFLVKKARETVRLSCDFTSPARPDKYCFSNYRGRAGLTRYGSGRVWSVYAEKVRYNIPCPFPDCTEVGIDCGEPADRIGGSTEEDKREKGQPSNSNVASRQDVTDNQSNSCSATDGERHTSRDESPNQLRITSDSEDSKDTHKKARIEITEKKSNRGVTSENQLAQRDQSSTRMESNEATARQTSCDNRNGLVDRTTANAGDGLTKDDSGQNAKGSNCETSSIPEGASCETGGTPNLQHLSPEPHPRHFVSGYFRIHTAKHVVFDDEEARRTIVDFFYDDHRDVRHVVRARGLRVARSDIAGDYCVMDCVSHDPNLGAALDAVRREWSLLWPRVKDKLYGNDLSLVVSHPHGCSKQFSIGRCLNREWGETPGGQGWYRYTFDAPTCPGSSGAPVWVPGRDGLFSGYAPHSGAYGSDTACSAVWFFWNLQKNN